MADSSKGWIRRHAGLLTLVVIGLLVGVICLESFVLWQQRGVMRSIQGQSSKLLNTFLEGDTAQVPEGHSVSIRLQNVRFKWSDRVYVDTHDMALRAVRAAIVVPGLFT